MQRRTRDYLSAPLPRTGHPLGLIAHACIALNGLAFGAFVGMFIGAMIAYGIVPWILGRQLSDPVGLTIVMVCLGITAIGGLWIGGWVIHRLNATGVSVILIALGFIPVIGIFFHIAHAFSEVWMRIRPNGRATTGSAETSMGGEGVELGHDGSDGSDHDDRDWVEDPDESQ